MDAYNIILPSNYSQREVGKEERVEWKYKRKMKEEEKPRERTMEEEESQEGLRDKQSHENNRGNVHND